MVGKGASTRELAAHKEALVESPFFRAALKKEGPEGQTHKIELPDADIDPVEDYLHFLYTQQVERLNLDYLARLYVLGQKMRDNRYKNAVLARILHDAAENPKYGLFEDLRRVGEGVNTIYEGTARGSPARELVVDIFHAIASQEWGLDGYCTEFKDDVLWKFMDSHTRGELGNLDISAYLEDVKDDD